MTGPAIDRATLDRLLDITGGDIEFLDELVDTYLEDGRAQVAALQGAVAASAVDDLVRPAHTLKSSSASVGALRLAEACRDLEASARAGTVDDPAGRVATIVARFGEARDELLGVRAERG